MFAGCNNTVVAGATSSNYLSVVDGCRRYPYCRAMAIFADIGRLNMRLVLTSSLDAVMTAYAVT